MPSFANTLRRWKSTVRVLRNSCAATSRVCSLRATKRATWIFLRSQLQDGGRVLFACSPAGGTELLSRPLCPRMGVELFKPVVGCLQVGSRLDSPTAPAQELAVRQLGAGAFERTPRLRMQRERFLIKAACGFTLRQQRPTVGDTGLFGSDARMGSKCVESAQPFQRFIAPGRELRNWNSFALTCTGLVSMADGMTQADREVFSRQVSALFRWLVDKRYAPTYRRRTALAFGVLP
jgi:hypothetical protein